MVSAEASAAAEAALEAGEAAAAAGNIGRAVEAFQLTLAHDPGYVTAQEWLQTLTKQQALHDAGTTRRQRSKEAVARARSPSPGRPSTPLPTTAALHASRAVAARLLGLLALCLLADTGVLSEVATRLRDGSPPTGQDHYAVLRLEHTATTEEVRKAFRVRSKETHPDLCATDSDPEVCGQTAQETVALAAEVLGDSTLRYVFDATREGPLARISEKAGVMVEVVGGFAQRCAGIVADVLRAQPLDMADLCAAWWGALESLSAGLARVFEVVYASTLAGVFLILKSLSVGPAGPGVSRRMWRLAFGTPIALFGYQCLQLNL